MSVSEKEQTVKFTSMVQNSSMLIWPQTDNIWEKETENTVAFPPTPIRSIKDGMIFGQRPPCNYLGPLNTWYTKCGKILNTGTNETI
jgi:hypothetical protein